MSVCTSRLTLALTNRADFTARLRNALEAYLAGTRCDCGEPIWVIGSAEAGLMCFTCITGSTDCSEDYEIAATCAKHSGLPL